MHSLYTRKRRQQLTMCGGGIYIYVQWTAYILNIPSQQVCLCRVWKHLFMIVYIYRIMYILGPRSSRGTLRVRPLWSPSGHILTPALSPFLGACVRSHAVRRRLFIVLMTAAHISPNVFSPQTFLTNIQWKNYYNTHSSSHTYDTYDTYHIHTYIHTFALHYTTHSCTFHIFISSVLRGRLAALNPLCPIHLCCTWYFKFHHLVLYPVLWYLSSDVIIRCISNPILSSVIMLHLDSAYSHFIFLS